MLKRRLKPVIPFTVCIMAAMVIVFGFIIWGSPNAMMYIMLGMALTILAIVLGSLEFDLRGEDDMELINLYKIWCKEKGLRPNEATNLKAFLNLIQK